KGYIDSLRLELMHEKAPVSVTLIQPSGINTPFGEHSLNRMDGRAKVPVPVYSPDIVAKAICHAAEHPTRAMLVGGSGRVMTLRSKCAPSLADRVSSVDFFKAARAPAQPKREMDGGFHEGGGKGEVYGGQMSEMRRTSVYAALRRDPVAATVGLATLLTGAAGLLLSRHSPVGR